MTLEHSHPILLCCLSILAWLVLSVPVLWPFKVQRLLDRTPWVLTVANLPLEVAVMVSPKAFRGIFEVLLGHSIRAKRFETDWQWINRWEIGVGKAFFALILIGGVWALVNLFRRRSWVTNTIAIAVALLLLYFRSRIGL